MTTTPGAKADWIQDWTGPGSAPSPENAGQDAPTQTRTPAWLQYAQESVNDGDRALEDLGQLTPTDRIALAQAHYLRTIAIATTEAAEHAETVATHLDGVVEQLSFLDDAVTLMIPKRRWTRLKFRK